MPDSTQQTRRAHSNFRETGSSAEKAHALYNFFCNFSFLFYNMDFPFVERIYMAGNKAATA